MGHQPIFFHPFSTLNCPDAWSKVPAQLQPNYRWQGAAYHWSHGQGIRGSHLIDLGCYNSWSKIITIWYRWSQGSCATTLASTRPTSWTSWGRNMLAMESGKIDLQYLPDVRWMWTKLIFEKVRSGHYERGHCWQLCSLRLVRSCIPDFLTICWGPTTVHVSCNREPAIVKANAITAASEATCLLLSVDETVKNPRSVDRLTISIKTSKH